MASALAFQTLFSLLPLLVLVLLVLNSVRGLEDAGVQLRNMLVEFMVPESLVEPDVDLVGPPEPAWSGHRSGVQRRAPGVASAHRHGARSAVRRELRRSRRRPAFCSSSTARPRWCAPSRAASTCSTRPTTRCRGRASRSTSRCSRSGRWPWSQRRSSRTGCSRTSDTFMGGWLAAPFAYVFPLFVTCVVLTLAFRTIPNTWVAWRAAVIGGAVGRPRLVRVPGDLRFLRQPASAW